MDCESDESERWEDFFGKPHRSIGFYVCEIKEVKKTQNKMINCMSMSRRKKWKVIKSHPHCVVNVAEMLKTKQLNNDNNVGGVQFAWKSKWKSHTHTHSRNSTFKSHAIEWLMRRLWFLVNFLTIFQCIFLFHFYCVSFDSFHWYFCLITCKTIFVSLIVFFFTLLALFAWYIVRV